MVNSQAQDLHSSSVAPRRFVICCDGTANEFAEDHTSVVKLTRAMVKEPATQQVIYHPGIGTRDPVGAGTRIGGLVGRLAGLAFGYDLKRDIADVYESIIENHRPGDQLFLFGFSRGAYTVRAVASLLKLYGLIMPGNEALIPYLVDMLWKGARIGEDPDRRDEFFTRARSFRETLSSGPCAPRFLGVWDTVSSVGWIGSPVSLPHTHVNEDIGVVRHAVSIDEHRAFFRTNLVKAAEGQDLKEVWFPGVHCDVGGGYAESTSGLSKYALRWMAREAAEAGLAIDVEKLALVLGETTGSPFAPASPTAPAHKSLTAAWVPAEFVPKRRWNAQRRRREWRMNLFRRRTLPQGCSVHEVAWQLGDVYRAKLPLTATKVS